MNRLARPAVWLAITIASLSLALGAGPSGQEMPKPRPILILGGTVFDAATASARRNDAIVVQDGRIKAMGLEAVHRAPKDARTIDASGRWIIPGLVDADVHLFETGGLDAATDQAAAAAASLRRAPAAFLRAYVCSGVTSVVNLGGPTWTFDLRSGRASDALAPRIATSGPLLVLAGPAPVAPGDDDPVWYLGDAEEAVRRVDQLAGLVPDLVAIRLEPWRDGDAPTLAAAVEAAHRRRLRVATRVGTSGAWRAAVEAGADVVVGHIQEELDTGLVQKMATQRTTYVPALFADVARRQVLERRVVFEPFERGCSPTASLESFDRVPPPQPPSAPAPGGTSAPTNLGRLVEAGVTIAAGSNAGDIRVLPGSSLHRELELMVEAGLSPPQALLSATRVGARLMGREGELGQLRKGMLADLVLLDADPLADIRNTRHIVAVIRGGALYER
jgi:imidazolonepropionase-like amidohydrolase